MRRDSQRHRLGVRADGAHSRETHVSVRVIVKRPAGYHGAGLWPEDVLTKLWDVRTATNGSSEAVFLDELERAGFRLCEVRTGK